MNNSYISLKHINKTLPDKTVLFDDLNYNFYLSNIYLVRAKSGFGKTTLLTIISKLEKPTSGVVSLIGFEDKNPFSYLFTDHMVFLGLTGRENLELVNKNKTLINKLCSKLGITELLNSKVDTYSKGELARLQLVRVLLLDKPIILLDEPTGNLDMENTKKVFSLLEEYKKDKLIICVSHNYQSDNIKTLEIRNENLFEVNQYPINNALCLNSNKKKNFMAFKYLLKFTSKIYKANLIKLIFLFVLTIILVFSTLIYSSKIDLNKRSIDLLNESNYSFVDSTEKTDYSYTKFSYKNKDSLIDCLISSTNTFYINNKEYILSDNSIILSSSLKEKNLELDNIKIEGYIDTKPVYSLVSLDIASAYLEENGFNLDLEEIIDLDNSLSKTNYNYLDYTYDYKHNNDLLINEVNLYCSSDNYEQLNKILSPYYNKELNLNSGVLSNYYNKIIIKSLISDDDNFSKYIEIETSDYIYKKIKTDSYNLINSLSASSNNVISNDYFNQMDLGNISVNSEINYDIYLDNLFVIFFNSYIYLLVLFYLIYIVLLIFVYSSIDRSFRYDKNLLRILGFSKLYCILIYSLSVLLIYFLSLIISMYIFNLDSGVINTFIYKNYIYKPVSFNMFKLKFPVISLSILPITLIISTVYSKNNKNFSLSLKKNKE